ncbi:MAG: NusA antitermination factor [Candidatus Moranbacteria bacterium GW2011_GWF2_36_839]|nr:MAG: NusA antitermination factor [Candidatus Moranbacteria bacterium GW2011_GWF1_36_78]KKQ16694.1 MAG: NusA antitermination factor [Candidatus Moranbacteria bacterium GW2011_GWF2_36_839]HAT74207.1 transcription termination/antitermination protein NusA [Candidatus Moranbacteria bacterium]HBY11425.1 transcription termination/antitermination protein NusA [Candidatus Moranbacteria bacterium]
MAKKKVKKDEENGAQGRTGDFGSAISALCEEKGISKEKVVETIEAALAAAYKKDYGKRGQNIRSEFDELTGGAKFFLVKEVVDETTREFPIEEEEVEDDKKKEKKGKAEIARDMNESASSADEAERLPRYNMERDLTLEEAKKIKKDAVIGDIIETELEQKSDYGRVAAQTAKQVIIQRIREAERDSMFEEYKNKEGEIISGVVQRVEGRNVFVDLGKSIGVLFPNEQIERENYRLGQRVKVYLQKVDVGTKGPGITLSRTNPDMVKKMFELEVPEIFAGTVEIKSIAREAGERTKIAVASTEDGIDPIGSCVGQKGTRVQAVIDELGGEKIDIVLWNEDVAKFISASLSPAKVLKVDIDEEKKEAVVSVLEDQLSLAIGKRGQNVRLAAKLTGWKIDIKGVTAKIDAEETQAETEEVEIENEAVEVKEEEKEEIKETEE